MDPKRCAASAAGLISYVPQDSSAALNPALRIGTQLMEILEVHGFGSSHGGARGAPRADDGRGAAAVRQGVPAAVSAPALRRPAAARGHRHGVRQPAQGHRPRRADHRPRRDHAGARAGHGPRPHQVLRGRGALRHARPGRGRQPGRPHRRHVRRPGGRDRHARRAVHRRPPPLHAQAARLHPRHHRGARPARHPRLGAASRPATVGLRLHAALRLGGRQVQRGVPAGRGREPGPPGALLALQGGRRADGRARHPAARQVALGSADDRRSRSSACAT